VCTTDSRHPHPVAANLLDQQFTAEAPNQRWVADTTECVLDGGQKVHLAVVLDLFSRFVVGWALGPANDRFLTLRALERALQRRQPGTGLLHHSDRGSTYASHDYRAVLKAHGITCSMSRTANCYDNAVAEAFFSTLKTELTDHFTSLSDATHQLFDYIDVFYNHQRRHSTIGYVSPAACERAFARAATDDGVALGGNSIPASALMGTPPSARRRASRVDSMEVH
jgi:transposase InsO family protein